MTKHDIFWPNRIAPNTEWEIFFFSSHMSSNIKLGINFDNRITLYSSLINHHFVVCHVPVFLHVKTFKVFTFCLLFW